MVIIKRNPFSFGSIVKEDDYCPRIKQEEKIQELLVSGQKVAIVGERRMGKTSLALHILEEKLNSPYIHVDFMGVRDEKEAASRILNAIAGTKSEFFKLETLLQSLGHLKPAITLDDSGKPSLTFNVRQGEVDESIDSAFKFLKKLSEKGITIFFDEFQDLLKIEDSMRFFGLLRSKIQTFSRIPFLYAGSHRSQMDKIFKDHDNPFYNGATVMQVETISKSDFHSFTINKMKTKNIKVSEEIFSYIYDMVYGISGDVQRFFRVAYLLIPKNIELNEKICEFVLDEILSSEQSSFEEVMSGNILTTPQRDLIRELAFDNTNPYTKDFMVSLNTTSSSGITRALNSLEKKNFIYKYKKEYRFYNPFLKEWIKKNFPK